MGTEEPGQAVASKQQVAEALTGIIFRLLDREVSEVSEDTELEGDLSLDSIHRVELSTRISDLYNITVGVEDLDTVDTFGELLDAVVARAPAHREARHREH
ncbi:hypothetical protein SMD44_00044 [Streptomyces alboflavus]|uniref:Carrier domain-containing protein n=1 Tax=Streptomyces alboflavus TaxID=67267 RepID=A0A1Z1W2K9_9ACTN|nr:phosphopantetheine-binding protein [Streptomyces alboflavus]ARX80646.1 hypothetical protein SMD44_00044 [Streptomyces alboflavus]